MSLNIAGTQPIDDPEYRYKMPRLVAKIEGRGNGIKTVIVNCVDIAYSLHRAAPEITKFFGCELGAQSKYDEKSERSVVNGAFDAATMQQHLSKYIEIFVLCPACRLPETKYKFKGHNISHKCAACGAISLLDMNHKLTTFLLKEHAANKRNRVKAKDEKKKRREKKDKNGSDPAEDDESHGSPSEKEKKEKSKKKKKDSVAVEPSDIEWHTDLSEAAVAARAQEAQAIEAAALNALEDVDEEVVATLENCQIDDSGAIDAAIMNVKSFLQAPHKPSDIEAEVRRVQTFGALPSKDRVVIFFRAVIDEGVIQHSLVVKYAKVFKLLVSSSDDHYAVIACCEYLCVIAHPHLITYLPLLLKTFYDEDILEEEYITSWAKPAIRKKYAYKEISDDQTETILESIKPFVDWLENAEEESDEE